MYSMTGYGKGEYSEGGVEVRVEIKSVNNRYLDVAVKAPRLLLSADDAIRSWVREYVSRGHLDIFISCTDRRERTAPMHVDANTVRGYASAAEEVKKLLPEIKDDLTLSVLLRMPDVVRTEDTATADGELLCVLEKAMRAALSALQAMRHAEGERLKCDLLSRMKTISSLREKIALRAPSVAEEYRKKMTERIQDLLGGKVDETRILTEASVFADKCNIDEELTRLLSHIGEFYEICKTEAVGRKLDFLIQEFNRECNTICSKSNDKEVTAAALEMKNEIEKVREQIQNLE